MSEAKKTEIETETQEIAPERKDEEADASIESQETQTKTQGLEDNAGETAGEESSLEGLSVAEELARMKAEYEERYNQMLRTIADFENSKKPNGFINLIPFGISNLLILLIVLGCIG